jgi:ATP-dependent Zn protease
LEHQAGSRQYSQAQLQAVDARVREILCEAKQRAAAMLSQHRNLVETLRDLLVERKVLDAALLAACVPSGEVVKKLAQAPANQG